MITLSQDFKNKYSEYPLVHTSIVGQTFTFADADIVENSLQITESVCSGDEIDFRGIEKSCLRFSIFDPQHIRTNLRGQTLTASQTVDTATGTLPLGVYVIDDAQRKGQTVDIIAYDKMSIFEGDVSAWFSTLVFPMTVSSLLSSLCSYLQVQTALPQTWTNSSYQIPSWTAESITGTAILSYLQEICAVFFRMDRLGRLTVCGIDTATVEQSLQPQAIQQEGAKIADYACAVIDKLQVITAEDRTTDVVIGSGNNVYIIQGNPAAYGMTQAAAQAIYDAMHAIAYKPFQVDLSESLPWLEVGDTVTVTTIDGQTATAPVLKRTLSGSKLTEDSYASNGLQLRSSSMSLSEKMNNEYSDLDRRVTDLEAGGGGGGLTKPIIWGTTRTTSMEDASYGLATDYGLRMTGTGGVSTAIYTDDRSQHVSADIVAGQRAYPQLTASAQKKLTGTQQTKIHAIAFLTATSTAATVNAWNNQSGCVCC